MQRKSIFETYKIPIVGVLSLVTATLYANLINFEATAFVIAAVVAFLLYMYIIPPFAKVVLQYLIFFLDVCIRIYVYLGHWILYGLRIIKSRPGNFYHLSDGEEKFIRYAVWVLLAGAVIVGVVSLFVGLPSELTTIHLA